jgi:hypothetical protein
VYILPQTLTRRSTSTPSPQQLIGLCAASKILPKFKLMYSELFITVGAEKKVINPLWPNNLKIRHAVSPLKIKIPSKNMREKSTNTPIIHLVY